MAEFKIHNLWPIPVYQSNIETKKENNMAQYAELQKALLLTNRIRKQREMLNGNT